MTLEATSSIYNKEVSLEAAPAGQPGKRCRTTTFFATNLLEKDSNLKTIQVTALQQQACRTPFWRVKVFGTRLRVLFAGLWI